MPSGPLQSCSTRTRSFKPSFDEALQDPVVEIERIVPVSQIAGPAEAREIEGNAPPAGLRCNSRQNVPPEIGRRGVSVNEQDRRAPPFFHVMDPVAENVHVAALEGERR